MVLNAGFFKRNVPLEKSSQTKSNVISVGGELFHATAVSLMDALKSHVILNGEAIKKLLGTVYRHFPKHIDTQAYLTPLERLNRLLAYPRKSELVECLAYSLRQLALDEVEKDCLNLDYRPLFEKLSQEVQHDFRDPKIPLPVCALVALTKSLETTVTLSIEEADKDLAKKQVFTGSAVPFNKKQSLFLKELDGQYQAVVSHASAFAHLGQVAIRPPEPENIPPSFDKQSLSQALLAIKGNNEELLGSYKHCLKSLETMLQADELGRDQLLHCLSWFAERSNHATYIAALAEKQQLASSMSKNLLMPKLEICLAMALSAMVAAKQLTSQQLFEALESFGASQPMASQGSSLS